MISLQRRAPDWPVKKRLKSMFQLRDWFFSSRWRCWVYHFWDWYGLMKDLLLSESIPWKKACCYSNFGADDSLPEGTFYWISSYTIRFYVRKWQLNSFFVFLFSRILRAHGQFQNTRFDNFCALRVVGMFLQVVWTWDAPKKGAIHKNVFRSYHCSLPLLHPQKLTWLATILKMYLLSKMLMFQRSPC